MPSKIFPEIYVVALISFAPFSLGVSATTYILRASHVYCATAWYSAKAFTIVCIIVLGSAISFIGYAYLRIYMRVSTMRKDINWIVSDDNSKISVNKGQHVGQIRSTITSVRSKNIPGHIHSEGNANNALDEKQMMLLIQSAAIVGSFLIG
ncbi:hypothetical protein HK100_000937 [Physocladia obscura]|uniref:Uncharacterized protein n=1 Tax=Physocladia obscura TaxID=109957 RepID=A0AAD5SXX4_9FUNG|nr:hypothetical protein HK100_000937 [Physocladia obscura]